MKIIKKFFTQDDFSIQLEDWIEDYINPRFNTSLIAVYPKGQWRSRFRAEADFNTFEEAEKAFEDICEGKAEVLNFDFTVMIPGGRRVPMKEILKRND